MGAICHVVFEILEQPPYYSDQTPSDYYIFAKLKEHRLFLG